MALRSFRLTYCLGNMNYILRSVKLKSTIAPFKTNLNMQPRELKSEENLHFLEDPDTFGSLSRKMIHKDISEDEDDIKEENYQKNMPLKSQKLTIKQYADIIKQYLQYKRIKEAIDVLEVRMLQEDKVKPENYIYNILIGACAEVGYTKKAFSLFNDMKRRGLKPTGDTYTCLFTACCNSPWPENGLKLAHHLKQLMREKGVEPNITNYNCMIKAFGKCGDLITAFKTVDEMKGKKIKIRVHTFNHLLHACISDKANGLRHAIILWRKMLNMREKPNIYSFNLMLKCVKDCDLGSLEDIQEMVQIIHSSIYINAPNSEMIESPHLQIAGESDDTRSPPKEMHIISMKDAKKNENALVENEIKMEFIGNRDTAIQKIKPRVTPNLLSKVPCMKDVLSLQPVHTPQGKFAIVGGQEDFLKEMEQYSVTPDIKTYTQMLAVIGDSTEEELCLIEHLKKSNVKTDISFYNMLIKKRCLRGDYKAAFEVQKMIRDESEFRKKRYSMNKKLRLNPNIMTYGVLAMACRTLVDAEKLLKEMEDKQLKINGEILGTLLKQGTNSFQFKYVKFILSKVIKDNISVNDIFLKHLEEFNDRCSDVIQNPKKDAKESEVFERLYNNYLKEYERFLTQTNIDEVLTPEHPWQQFKEPQPETFQKSNIIIEEPKRFFKKKRKFVAPYTARV